MQPLPTNALSVFEDVLNTILEVGDSEEDEVLDHFFLISIDFSIVDLHDTMFDLLIIAVSVFEGAQTQKKTSHTSTKSSRYPCVTREVRSQL